MKNRLMEFLTNTKAHIKLKKGQIIILTFVFFTVITILSATFFTKTTNFLRRASATFNKELAFQLAEAGIDKALHRLEQGLYESQADGTTSTYSENLGSPNDFTISLYKNGVDREITSTGYVRNSANTVLASSTAKVKAKFLGPPSKSSPFTMAAQVGAGGIVLRGSLTPAPDSYTYIYGNVRSNAYIDYQTNFGSCCAEITGNATATGFIDPEPPLYTGSTTPSASPSPLPSASEWYNDITGADWASLPENVYSGPCTLNSGTLALGFKVVECSTFQLNCSGSTAANLELTGPVWIKGNFYVAGSYFCTTKPQVSVSSTSGYSQAIVTDGSITVRVGRVVKSGNKYVMLIANSPNAIAFTIDSTAGQLNDGALSFVPEGAVNVQQWVDLGPVIANSLCFCNWASDLYFDTSATTTSIQISENYTHELVRGTYQLK